MSYSDEEALIVITYIGKLTALYEHHISLYTDSFYHYGRNAFLTKQIGLICRALKADIEKEKETVTVEQLKTHEALEIAAKEAQEARLMAEKEQINEHNYADNSRRV